MHTAPHPDLPRYCLQGDVSDPRQQGVVPRAVRALGAGIAADASGAEWAVRLSVVEIYCERVRCLLAPPGEWAAAESLQIKQDAVRGMFVEGALCRAVPGAV